MRIKGGYAYWVYENGKGPVLVIKIGPAKLTMRADRGAKWIWKHKVVMP